MIAKNGSDPAAGKPIYLDHHATTPVDPAVVDSMLPHFTTSFGNPHAVDHFFGWKAEEAVEEARRSVANLIGADPDEIIFTSGATEANNIAILGTAARLPPNRRRILVSAIEHKSVLGAARAAAETHGVIVEHLPVDGGGRVDPANVARRLDGSVGLVSVMAVNNEIGTRQPVDDIAAICADAGALLHVDAAQAMAFDVLDVQRTRIDLMSLSSHKAYGPAGIGALFVSRDARVRPAPLFYGGGQEGGLRPGTLPVPLCVGFGRACELASRRRTGDAERVLALRGLMLRGLREADPSVEVIGDMVHRHPGNLCVRFPGLDGDLVVSSVQPRVAISSGSACDSGSFVPSHVITALGLDDHAADEVIRIGIGRGTTLEEVETAVDLLAASVRRLRRSLRSA